MTASRAATFLKGLVALVALIFAVVGVPILLLAVAGSPIPSAIPAWDGVWASLTSRDDGALLLGILKHAAWAGWALFVLSVVADVVTRLRGLPVPRLGPQQQLATQLVGAVLALTVSVPTALPAAAFPAASTSASHPVAASGSGVQRVAAAGLEIGKVVGKQQPFEEYRVRRGDCLWDIAWNELGEPEMWPEIYQASRTVRQPDGRRLTDPDLIVTGWVLHIPAAVTQREAKRMPNPRRVASPHIEARNANAKVATPLFGPAGDAHTPRRNERQESRGATDRESVTTPLSTAGHFLESGALETRWLAALDQDTSMGRNWRSHILGPKS